MTSSVLEVLRSGGEGSTPVDCEVEMSESVREAGDRSRGAEAEERSEGADIDPRQVRVLAISGSLRAASSNTALLRAASSVSPEGVEVVLFGGLDALPHFTPDLDDLEGGAAPSPVMDLRARLGACDGVVISSPEYAHGVPGALKNALDWIVGSGEIHEKPVAVLNASRNATHAHAALVEILSTADALVVGEASVRVGLPTNRIDEAGILSVPELSETLRLAVAALVRAIEVRRAAAGDPGR